VGQRSKKRLDVATPQTSGTFNPFWNYDILEIYDLNDPAGKPEDYTTLHVSNP
jgi:hypothetical protein